MIRILLVADVILFRGALATTLTNEEDFQVTAEMSCADLAAGGPDAVAKAGQPDVVIIDLDARRAGAFVAIRTINEYCPDCRIVLLTGMAAPDALRRALHSKVRGLVSKDSPPARLVDAIRTVADGERVIEATVALAALSRPGNALTARELEILRLVAEGLSAAEIGNRLYLTCGTVRNYLSTIIRKCGARNRIEAVRVAQEAHWL